jgi:hypothetical protein
VAVQVAVRVAARVAALVAALVAVPAAWALRGLVLGRMRRVLVLVSVAILPLSVAPLPVAPESPELRSDESSLPETLAWRAPIQRRLQ